MAIITPPRAPRAMSSARRRDSNEVAPVRHLDLVLLGLPILLSAIGMVMIYSSTRTHFGTYYVERQGVAIVIGIIGMFVVMAIDSRKSRALYPLVYLAIIPLLVGVLALGASRKGAQAWFQVGPLQFEPSEIVKILIVIAIAGYCHQHRGDLDA